MAGPKGRGARTVVDALAQPLQFAAAGQARQSLGDSRKGLVAEIIVTPKPFPTPFNLLADEAGCFAGFGALFHLFYDGAASRLCQVFLRQNLTSKRTEIPGIRFK